MSLALLDRKHTVAPPGYNRWLIPPAALAIHLCIGQAYATSVYKTSLVANFDASLTSIGIVFSIAIVMLGLSAAVLGTWVDTGGPRRAMVAAAIAWSLGFLVGAAGIATGQIWLLYLGYGVIGGIGLGIGYISPGLHADQVVPGPTGSRHRHGDHGVRRRGARRLARGEQAAGLLRQRLQRQGRHVRRERVGGGEHVRHPGRRLPRVMLFGAWLIKVPDEGWVPDGFDASTVKKKAMVTTASVSAANAVKTPQFWLLWIVLFCNVTAGIGILEQAAPMIQDFFRTGGTSSVDPAAAAGFVGLLSICNMGGRFAWSSTSDVVGRKPIYMAYLGIGIVLYALLALAGHTSTGLFVLFAGVIISFYGGGFATAPAYLRDLFGTYQVGAIHGRLLTAWSAAGVAGPLIVNGFLDAEGEPGNLTSDAYKPALLTMVGVLAVGFVANLLIRQVADRFHEAGHEERQLTGTSGDRGGVATATRQRTAVATRPVLLVVAWAVVGLPLVYGVYQTVVKASSLFG